MRRPVPPLMPRTRPGPACCTWPPPAPDLVPVITRAIDDPGYAAGDQVSLTVSALVALALQTEVKLTRNTQGRWTFAKLRLQGQRRRADQNIRCSCRP
jgi:hypothetical protein